MRPHRLFALVILFAAPAGADLYKWVDERGVTHYSDLRPTKLPATARIEPVTNRVSVYSPDKSLLQAVEAARLKKPAPEVPIEHHRSRAPYGAAMQAPPPLTYEPCVLADCAIVSGVQYPHSSTVFHPIRRRPPNLMQAVLPPGAIAGTINSNGAIPGNTAGVSNVLPETMKPGPRMRPMATRHFREPHRQ